MIGGTALSVTLTVLFNLISDLLGGIRVTVLEEEVMVRPEPLATGQAAGGAQRPAGGSTPVTRPGRAGRPAAPAAIVARPTGL